MARPLQTQDALAGSFVGPAGPPPLFLILVISDAGCAVIVHTTVGPAQGRHGWDRGRCHPPARSWRRKTQGHVANASGGNGPAGRIGTRPGFPRCSSPVGRSATSPCRGRRHRCHVLVGPTPPLDPPVAEPVPELVPEPAEGVAARRGKEGRLLRSWNLVAPPSAPSPSTRRGGLAGGVGWAVAFWPPAGSLWRRMTRNAGFPALPTAVLSVSASLRETAVAAVAFRPKSGSLLSAENAGTRHVTNTSGGNGPTG